MNKAAAFLQLVRWPNLFFIALTQGLFQYCLLHPVFKRSKTVPVFDDTAVAVLIIASLFIAAAGYIINDYFDINIDQVNKPHRQFIPTYMTRRWAILWHSLLSFFGVVLSFYVGWRVGVWWIGPSNFLCAFLLFVYSTTFKKRFLSGNVIIALLTAWTLAVLGLASFYQLYFEGGSDAMLKAKILRFTILYAAFAFVSSLIREAVKDIEDMRGDAQYGCKTLPIVAGINAAKTYVLVWLVVLVGALVVVQVYAAQLGWWLMAGYGVLCIIGPLLLLARRFVKASGPQEYHRIASFTKVVMLAGILSLFFFKFYL